MKQSDQTVLILGGTSAVGISYARLKAAKNSNIILAGRNAAALKANKTDLEQRGAGKISVITGDLGRSDGVVDLWSKIISKHPSISRVCIVYGSLGDQDITQKDFEQLRQNLDTNFVSTALWAELSFDHFLETGTGGLTVIGSVAGDRGRQSNYHYGAAKGGLDVFMSGMAHRAAKTVEADISTLLVKPGFIDTPMTDHLDKSGPLWSQPDLIARIIDKAERRGAYKIYAPWYWRFILLIIRFVPFFIFKKTSL